MQKSLRLFLLAVMILASQNSIARQTGNCLQSHWLPFSTDSVHLTIWNGSEYLPFFVKSMNMGVAVPGKFPGELEVSKEQYAQWFQMIKDAGFNSIRLYTLHFPHFYEVLDSFNLANAHNPLFFFQGVWLEEELEGYDHDLYFLTGPFTQEIEENVDCVHGNRVIPQRQGKAWGVYQTDVSRWNIGYIIGREVHPGEVLYTNELYPQDTFFEGAHFAIDSVLPTETWVTARLDHLVGYEYQHYQTMRPVSFSSWPTQDPLHHPEEWNPWEDTTSIDLSRIRFLNAPAGYFASYHAYPYYPDYISYDPNYQGYADQYGPNSYLGYLTAMKAYYNRFPLIIAEFGVPSSWGIAHYSTSGMHHGGFDEYEQGEVNIRLLKTIEAAGCGGGAVFAWMDEWFKRTWITDHIDYLMDRRILWHNITAAEQNFGLISFQRPLQLSTWEEFCDTCRIQRMEAAADYDFFHLTLHLSEPMSHPDEMWISLDTYAASLGESILPTGDTVSNRAEFALHITNHSAKLYVTQAYDLYGIYHGVSSPQQQYRSVATDGDPWFIVRWRNNDFHQDVQYIGNMKVNYGFLPANSKDAVTLYTDRIHIRLPWSLLHFVDPSEYVVFHDDRATPWPEDTISDGISVSVFYRGKEYTPSGRFLWENWNTALDAEEVIKGSYWAMKDRLHEFNNPAIAVCDSFSIRIGHDPVLEEHVFNVLDNDFDMDGNFMQTLLYSQAAYGRVDLLFDGSFSYTPTSVFNGIDSFSYVIFDGYSLSAPAQVSLHIDNANAVAYQPIEPARWKLYPNPVRDQLTISSELEIEEVMLFDVQGRKLFRGAGRGFDFTLDVSHLPAGSYVLTIRSQGRADARTILVGGKN
ncbi:MAG: Ig-like domain-containing protein [Bacteroidales bacterium]